ncbi:glycosyltransferase family 4 protein [Chthonobacter rhizosphaerae]|uniref:glycosyltransferase family 4 protein n=1 Tax=Chthonobacter rhizosphaerae TaxID=2735553 RepID=UPI0015EEDC31|nr:glycosyltransferase family 4 protein [Chthonobacter rhizosphaerae]
MRTVFLSQHFDGVRPPDQNSVGIWTYEVARRLAHRHDVTVIARQPPSAPSRQVVDGLGLEFVAGLPVGAWTKASRLWALAAPGARPLFAQPFYAADFLLRSLRRIRRIGPDLIHVQNFPQHVPAVRRAAPNAAIVLHMHCDWLVQLDRATMRRGIDAADLVIGCSRHVIEAAAGRHAGAGIPFEVVPNGTTSPPAAPTLERPAPKVVFVGRVSPEKGLHTLADAWPRVVAAVPEARLEIVGPQQALPRDLLVDLADDPDVRALARFYGARPGGRSYMDAVKASIPPQLAHTVTFAGPIPYDQVAERLAGAAVLVNPSLSESFGMSLVEALSAGTPVVATRAGGMPDILEATGGGLLVEKNDPAALAAALVRLLTDRGLARALAAEGAGRARDLYAWDRIADLTAALHERTMAARRKGREPLTGAAVPHPETAA